MGIQPVQVENFLASSSLWIRLPKAGKRNEISFAPKRHCLPAGSAIGPQLPNFVHTGMPHEASSNRLPARPVVSCRPKDCQFRIK